MSRQKMRLGDGNEGIGFTREDHMPELETAHIDNCTVYHLPGRDWYYLLGPQNSQARNLA